MCSIGGYIAFTDKLPKKEEVTRLFIEMEKRGSDAAGFMHFDEDGNIVVKKAPMKSSSFILTKDWNNLKLPQILIMHTRAATQGPPEENSNNHPIYFEEDRDIAIIHNGVIQNEYDFGIKTTEADSKAILKALLKNKTLSIEENIRLTAESLYGGYAVVGLRKGITDEVFFFRHTNPIKAMWDARRNILFFASEEEYIISAINHKEKNAYGFTWLESHLHSITFPNNEGRVIRLNGNHTKVTFTPKTYTYYSYGYYGGMSYPSREKKEDRLTEVFVECPTCGALTAFDPDKTFNECEWCMAPIYSSELNTEDYSMLHHTIVS